MQAIRRVLYDASAAVRRKALDAVDDGGLGRGVVEQEVVLEAVGEAVDLSVGWEVPRPLVRCGEGVVAGEVVAADVGGEVLVCEGAAEGGRRDVAQD